MKYRSLNPEKIIETQRRLRERIAKRFPGSGLSEVAAELLSVAESAVVTAAAIRRPNLPLRIGVAAVILAALGGAVAFVRMLRVREDLSDVSNLVQFVESGIASLVFLSAAVVYLVTLETRRKRPRALKAIHELRAIAHVIDMHQVAKDPEGLAHRAPVVTQSREQTTQTLFDLNKYLNYCNELLVIVSKIAAIYVQEFPDASSVTAVDQIETLCSGLSQKISQKMLILEQILDDPPALRSEPPAARPDPAASQ